MKSEVFLPQVSVVLPTYQRAAYLQKAIQSFYEQTYPADRFEVFIVDDGSRDETPEVVASFQSKVSFKLHYLKNPAKGQTMARNLGFKSATGEIVVSTDDDIEACPEWLLSGIRHFQALDVFAVEGRIIMQGEVGPFLHGVQNEAGGTYQTANMFYRREALSKAGYLDEHLNQWWNFASDFDLALRLKALGGRIVFAPEAWVRHPVYELTSRTMLRNALKSGAIPYLFRKHGLKLPHHLKMSLNRIMIAGCVLGMVGAGWLESRLGALIFLGLLLALIAKLVPLFLKASWSLKLKVIIVYALGSLLNVFSFLRGCVRYRVFPNRKMFRL